MSDLQVVTGDGISLAREVFETSSELRTIRHRIVGLQAAETALSWRAAEAKERLDAWLTEQGEG